MHPMLNIAVRAVRKAGNIIIKFYENSISVEETHENKQKFITNVYLEAERQIISTIRKSYRQHTIISIQNGKLIGEDKDIQWFIHPLDNTTNYIKRSPYFCISIAIRIKERTEVAVIYDPILNELFNAVRGQGAQLNGYRLRGSTARNLEYAILATRFPFKAKEHTFPYMNILSKLFNQCANFRCTGSALLDMAYVAAGRVDGYFEIGVNSFGINNGLWELTAAELLLRESGSVVTDFLGGHGYIMSGNIITGNPKVVKAILAHVRGSCIK